MGLSDEYRALTEMRAAGWSVAVHNDYRLNGEPQTFWLFTHPNGRWVKGEASTDAKALAVALNAASEQGRPPPVQPGTGYCQPTRDGVPQPRVWMIQFEDPDRGNAVFTGPGAEAEARAMWAKVEPAWNCYLFATAPAERGPPWA